MTGGMTYDDFLFREEEIERQLNNELDRADDYNDRLKLEEHD